MSYPAINDVYGYANEPTKSYENPILSSENFPAFMSWLFVIFGIIFTIVFLAIICKGKLNSEPVELLNYPEQYRPGPYEYPANFPDNGIRRPVHSVQFGTTNVPEMSPGLPEHLVSPQRSRESVANWVARQEPIYESIPEYEIMKPFERPAPDISQRPPHPLPPDVVAQSGRYIHYDTPYEDRIFRLGRLRCERNPNGGGGHVVIPETPRFLDSPLEGPSMY